ncbi:hypothetical protein FRB94_009685 [Tulasnella sp. JGI-2019a]|nr:hypothetical protein FRB94_009685 [Tulasnella sp. JGI-2019a]
MGNILSCCTRPAQVDTPANVCDPPRRVAQAPNHNSGPPMPDPGKGVAPKLTVDYSQNGNVSEGLAGDRLAPERIGCSQNTNVSETLRPDGGADIGQVAQTSKVELKSAASYLLGGTKISLSTLQAISALVPVPWLGPTISAALQVITVAQSVSGNSNQSKDLQERTYGLMIVILTSLRGMSEEELSQGNLKTSIDSLASDISSIADELQIIRADANFRCLSALANAVLTSADIQGRIADCSTKLDWAMKVFQVESHIQSRLDDLQRHREILDAIRIFDDRLDHNTRLTQGNLLRQALSPADAQYDSHSRKAASSCLGGTRVALLQQIRDWVYSQDPTQLRMWYLYGLAGTGKSTIAETIARYCAEGGNLGATFFFARDYTDRRDAVHVFPTIAYQLASLIPSFQDKLVKAVEANPGVYRSGLLEQLKKLIIEPLRDAIDAPSPLVFVFDALDECGDAPDAQELLKLLALAIKQLPPRLRIRIFVTSRPEVSLRTAFSSFVTRTVSHVAELHNIEDHIVQADIRLYLHAHLRVPPEIATEDETERLVKMARTLFIVASTAVKFVEDSFYTSLNERKEQLNILLSAEDSYVSPRAGVKGVGLAEIDRGPPPYHALDAMYLTILAKGLPERRNTYVENRLRSVLGAVVTLFDMLSPRALEALLGLETDAACGTLQRLHSVIIVPDHDPESTPLRLIHPSFPNFLTTSSRCTDTRFFVDSAIQHSRLALICLNHMNNLLERDMCNIGFLPTLNSEVKDLEVQLRNAVPLHLRYSCYNWASHMALSKPRGAAEAGVHEAVALELVHALDTFVCKKLLYWLEALSLLSRLDVAIPLLKLAEKELMGMVNVSKDTIFVIRDAQRFVMRFFEPISLSAGCVYSSALPLTPKCHLYNIYQTELSNCVDVRIGQNMGWDPCLRVIQVGSGVNSVAFSPSGHHVASGSLDGVVRLVDAETGVIVGTLEGHSRVVRSVAFSPEGDQLASGSDDMTVRIWDMQTGAEIATLEGHTDRVTSVTFSPTGNILASASEDKTIRLWAMQTGSDVTVINEHNREIQCLAFSQDGHLLAYGSDDGLVHVWDKRTSTEVAKLTGHSAHVSSITFSPKGDRLASSSHDGTAVIWNMQTGAALATISSDTYLIESMVFSPQGDRLATGAEDWTVRLWNSMTGANTTRLNGHDQSVTSVAFSPNGDRLASGSEDQTIRLWDVQPGVEFTALRCHSDAVSSLQFSPQGGLLVSGGWDKTIRLWNVHSGAAVATLPVDGVPDVSFSPDDWYVKYTYRREGHEWDITSFASTAQADNPRQSVDLNMGHRVRWKAPWIMYGGWRLCYLGGHINPSETRGALIVLGAGSGEVFLLDFTAMIRRIRERNISSPYSYSDSSDDI